MSQLQKSLFAWLTLFSALLLSVFALLLTVISGGLAGAGDAAVWVWLSASGLFLLSLPLAFLFSIRISRRVSRQIAAIHLDRPKTLPSDPEFEPLRREIERQNTRITERMSELQARHEEQDTMRREFTANVSHELKTPLTSISGYAEIIRNGIAKEADIPRFAGKIYDESQRLITLVGDIIKLSQLDEKEVPVRIEEFDLLETCRAVLSQLEMAAAEKQVTVELEGESLTIRGAEQIAEEIIFNLCDNAIKYNRPGGRVTVKLRQCVDGAQLTVRDTGIGIPEADQPRVFERFYRVDKSHSKEIGGTGLGLSIVKHGARFMGAEVSLESKVGIGTTVRVLF